MIERQTQTWMWSHAGQGLAELNWALFDDQPPSGGQELAFYLSTVNRFGEPALMIGAGAGRLLLDLLAVGIEIEGVEPSEAMLEYCVSKAIQAHARLTIYGQRMERLSLSRRYRTIIVPYATFTHVVDRTQAMQTLSKLHEHLLPGGALVLDIEIPHPSQSARMAVREMPRARSATETRRLLEVRRQIAFDPVEQTSTEQREYRLCEGDRLLQQEFRLAKRRWYSRHELVMMLAWAGFGETEVIGLDDGFNLAADSGACETLVFIAQR